MGAGPVLNEVRAVVLTSYLEVARHVGLDPFEMLREVGIRPAFLEDPENRCAAGPVVDLLENSARKSNCPSFGLLMAECRSFASLGPLSLLLQHLPTVGDVLKALTAYRRHQNDVIELAVDDDGETVIARWDLIPEFAKTQVIQLTVAMGYIVLRGASGGRWKPATVHFVHSAPEDLSIVRRLFPYSLQFESDFNGLAFESNAMAIPLPRADEAMAFHARRLLKLMRLDNERESFTSRTRRTIILLLPRGGATLEQVALNMDLTPRGLQRRLERENQTFGMLLRETRRELAERYLTDTEWPISTIADLTGYSSLSAFGRWFTAEFGTAPQAWRAERIIYSALRN